MTGSGVISLYVLLGVLLVVDAQSDRCTSDLSISLPSFNASRLACQEVWKDFILRYSQNGDNVLSIILSSKQTTGWIGMGFSETGMMVGSSAMIGWIGEDKKPNIHQYFLGGKISSMIETDQGDLKTVDAAPPVASVFGQNMYMAFQLKFQAPVGMKPLLFAYGTKIPVKNVLTMHKDMTSINFDFSQDTTTNAQSSSISTSASYPYNLKRNHGALAIAGWGVLLPIGAIVARHCKQWDPLWYNMHIGIQFLGFIIGTSAIVVGNTLYNKLHADVQVHRSLGIFIFVIGILQVTAYFIRPDKEFKYRVYWNWYHHWFGRLALFLASVNIVIGIRVAGAGQAWKVAYGFNLAFILIIVIVLEIMLRRKQTVQAI